ncbi:hypothetical protein Tco_0802318 [Tanacetum coccineum]|uniref:Uncharacterized protein n=1 Tax=Tanacetum coccineum TaxID=301880 RepID=A0ABQ5A2H4_9ASTR
MSTIKQDPWRHYKTSANGALLWIDQLQFHGYIRNCGISFVDDSKDKFNSLLIRRSLRSSIEDFEAQQAIKKVDEHLMDEDIEKIVEGDEESDANNPEAEKSAYVMQIDEEVEEESAEDALIRKKGKEELKELMTFEPTSSSTKPKTLCSKHIKGVIARMSMRYGYIFRHMKKSFMPRKDMDVLGNMVEETLKLERENTKADIVAMVAEAERKEQECTRATLSSQMKDDKQACDVDLPIWLIVEPCRVDAFRSRDHEYHHDDDARPEGESSPKGRTRLSMKEDLSVQIRRELAPIFHSCERDPNAPLMILINKYLFYLTNGNSETRKYVLSLHKYHAVPFPENALKERNTQWLCHLERVHDYQLGLESYQQKVNLTALTLTFYGIEKEKLLTITSDPLVGLIYKNSKKEKSIMDINEIQKFCDATLKRVLEKVKKFNLDVKHGYTNPYLSKDNAEHMMFYEEYI